MIQKGETDYIQSVEDNFQAICELKDFNKFDRFLMMLKRKEIACVHLTTNVVCGAALKARFQSSFVARVVS